MLIAVLVGVFAAGDAWAQDRPAGDHGQGAAAGGSASGSGKRDETPGSNDEIISGPFSEYGEFDSSEDEENDERFFQFGRFFGLGLGGGMTTATGNAGKLYQGGFPTLEGKLLYWFDFQFALQVAVQNSKHNYDREPDGPSDVNLFRTLFQLKYYFDTRNLSAPITFIGPYLVGGGGYYSRTDNVGAGTGTAAKSTVQSYSAFGFNAGFGFELTIKPRKVYLEIEGLAHFVQFADNLDARFSKSGVPDRTGAWLGGTTSVVFTW